LGGGVTEFSGASLTALNFSFDDGLINFALSNDPAASVYFLNGNLSEILYGATESSGSLSFGAGIPALAYGFVDTNNGELSSAGTISLAAEPSTLLLWGTSLLALGAIFRKKLAVS
jgi:hypothetical protein